MRILLISMFLLITTTFSGQSNRETEREINYPFGLLGPVRTVRTEKARVFEKNGKYVESPRVLAETATFNENGDRTELDSYDPKGSLAHKIVTVYEGRRVVESLNYNAAGQLEFKVVRARDDAGRPAEDLTYNGDGSLRSKTLYRRDARGRLIEQAEFDANGTLVWKQVSADNGVGNNFERLFYKPDGSLLRREIVTKDPKAKTTETITYEEDGSVAEKSSAVDNDSGEVNEMSAYDANGTLQIRFFSPGTESLSDEITSDNRGATQTGQFYKSDEIDSHGNWIKRTRWISTANKPKPFMLIYRTITYY
jgi:hypothetical protein